MIPGRGYGYGRNIGAGGYGAGVGSVAAAIIAAMRFIFGKRAIRFSHLQRRM